MVEFKKGDMVRVVQPHGYCGDKVLGGDVGHVSHIGVVSGWVYVDVWRTGLVATFLPDHLESLREADRD